MKNLKVKAVAIGVAAATVGMTGCTTTAINESKEIASQNKDSVVEKFDQSKKMTASSTTVSVIDDMFVSGKSFRLTDKDTLPKFFNEKVIYAQVEPASLNEILGDISVSINSRIDLTSDAISYLNDVKGDKKAPKSEDSTEESVDEEVDYAGNGLVGSEQSFSISYNGTIAGLLDVVTSKTNLYWKWDRNHISFYRLDTKNFIFDGDAAVTTFDASVSTNRNAAEAGKEASSTSASSMQSSTIKNNSGSQVADMIESLKAIVSDEGKFSVSISQGIVTVTDTPESLDKVQSYVEQINSIVNKRIAVKTEVYEIRIEDTANLGMDINALYNSAIDVAGATTDFSAGLTKSGLNFKSLGGGRFGGSSAIIDALAKVSNVSLVTSSMNYTTNGKLVPVQVAKEKGIVSKMTPIMDEDGKVMGFEASPSSVLSGLTMNLTPRINSNGDVDLNFAADLSSLDDVRKVPLGDEGYIEIADRSFKNFMQRASVNSGETLMIAGFDRTENRSDVESLAGESMWALGGSKKGGKVRIMTMIMVTPYIMAK